MIVGRNFVWLHFPKSGGHTVDQALRAALRGKRDAAFDASSNRGWHDSVKARQGRQPDLQISNQVVVCGIRRLPYWMLSAVHYEASRPPYLAATREMLCRGEFYFNNGLIGRANDYALHFLDSGVERWIRTEHLAEDFERQFGDVLESHLMRAAVRKVRRVVNGTRLNYIRDLDYHFTQAELDALYAANPTWAELERQVYGDLLRLPDRTQKNTYFLDRKMRILAVSETALRIWGRSIDDVIGKPLLEVFPRAKDSIPYAAHLTALRTMQKTELESVSPTFEQPVQICIDPRPTGLEVSFELKAA